MGARTDTRDRMVASAGSMLREHGVAGTSFAKVLEHSGGPRGSIGFHFPGGKAELVTDALRWASGRVTDALARAREDGTPPVEVFAGICAFYAAELTKTDFRAGCPVGAVAQEAYDDEALGAVVGEIVETWVDGLARLLAEHGRTREAAEELATTCVASLEGAILLARVRRSRQPIDAVLAAVGPLLD